MKKKSGTSVIQQRLFEICDEMAVSRRAFSMNIGKSASYLTNLVDDITTEVLNSIFVKYPQINLMWIITGTGDKFVSPDPTDALFQHLKEENKELKIRNEELSRELGRLEEQITEMKKMGVRQDTSAGCADASGSDLTTMK